MIQQALGLTTEHTDHTEGEWSVYSVVIGLCRERLNY